MNLILSGQASKALISFAAFAATMVTTFFPHATWEPAVIAGINMILVYLVPNAQPPVPPPPAQPVPTPPAAG